MAKREEMIAKALQRAGNLGANIGNEVGFPLEGRKVLIGRFGGWLRKERMAYWDSRGHGYFAVHAETFTEKGHTFKVPETKAILVRVVNNPKDGKKEIRIVTEPAGEAVGKYHDRQPVLVDKKEKFIV